VTHWRWSYDGLIRWQNLQGQWFTAHCGCLTNRATGYWVSVTTPATPWRPQ